jgi:uncharacterized membrane protein
MELGTFLVNVYKGAVDKVTAYNGSADSKSLSVIENQVYYLEKTLIKTFFESDVLACDAYISKMKRRLDLIRITLQSELATFNVDCQYLIRFVRLCNTHVITERKALPKDVLKILNIIYKRKGDIIDIYKK